MAARHARRRESDGTRPARPRASPTRAASSLAKRDRAPTSRRTFRTFEALWADGEFRELAERLLRPVQAAHPRRRRDTRVTEAKAPATEQASTPRPARPADLSAAGSRLIEASAGTGKTWTIAALYLRLVLGHGGDAHGFARALAAARNPGRDLHRGRDQGAARPHPRAPGRRRGATSAGEAAPDPHDALSRRAARRRTRQRSGRAARTGCRSPPSAMDEAAVSTIHGWCQRMLREHAFDSGSLFTQKLEADQSDLLGEVAARLLAHVHRSTPTRTMPPRSRRSIWAGPATLMQSVANLVGFAELLPTPPVPPAEVLRTRDRRARRSACAAEDAVGQVGRRAAAPGSTRPATSRRSTAGSCRRVDVDTRWLDELATLARRRVAATRPDLEHRSLRRASRPRHG